MLPKNSSLRITAQKLRKEATPEENRLWYEYLRQYLPRFHRQYVISRFVADFYCHQARLVVELDGAHHKEEVQRMRDEERTRWLEALELKVIRFSNARIRNEFRRVCAEIDQAVNEQMDTMGC